MQKRQEGHLPLKPALHPDPALCQSPGDRSGPHLCPSRAPQEALLLTQSMDSGMYALSLARSGPVNPGGCQSIPQASAFTKRRRGIQKNRSMPGLAALGVAERTI